MPKSRILVPSGIGDIYWVMVKLRGFLKEKDIKNPEIWIDAQDDKRRSLLFVKRIPFVAAGGYYDGKVGLKGKSARREAYRKNARHIFPNVDGFDYFISYNGSMDRGIPLEEADRYPVEWDINFKKDDLIGEQGDYFVSAFFDAGHYQKWINDLGYQGIYSILSKTVDTTGTKVILTGASWDDSPVNQALLKLDKSSGRLESKIGETTLDEYFSLLLNSKGCIGFPAGNTIMSTVFKKPTLIIWNQHYNKKMWTNSCPPSENYIALGSDSKNIAESFINLIQR